MGTDTKPNYTTYDAVVSLRSSPIFAQTAGLEGRGKCGYALVIWVTCPKGTLTSLLVFPIQPHPDVKPMAYANSLMSMFGFM